MPQIRNSAKAVIVHGGKLLVCRCKDDVGDWYCLPGGGQEPGEFLPDTLVRECREEISAPVRVGNLLFVRDYIGRNHEFAAKDGDVHQVEFMYRCEIDANANPATGPVLDFMQTGVAWLPLAALSRKRIYPKLLGEALRDLPQGIAPLAAPARRNVRSRRNAVRALIVRDGRVLLVRNENRAGVWHCLPGGIQEHGESMLEAIKRECREEIGATVRTGPLVSVRDVIGDGAWTNDQDVQTVESIFRCELAAPLGEPAKKDAAQAGVEWVNLAKLGNLRLWPTALSAEILNGNLALCFGDVN